MQIVTVDVYLNVIKILTHLARK